MHIAHKEGPKTQIKGISASTWIAMAALFNCIIHLSNHKYQALNKMHAFARQDARWNVLVLKVILYYTL